MSRSTLALAGAAATVAAVLLALGGCLAWAVPVMRPLPLLWCFVPLVWCAWAALTPASWVPQRLPVWGAVLGAIAWLFGAMIVNVPARLADIPVPLWARALAVLPLVLIYYLVWTAVRALYRRLVEVP